MRRCLSPLSAAVAVLALGGCATADEPKTETVTSSPTASPTTPAVAESPSPSPSAQSAEDDLADAIGPCAGGDVSDELERIQWAYYEQNTGGDDDFDAYTEALEYVQQVQRDHFDTSEAIRQEHGQDVSEVYCRHWLDEQNWEKPESQALAEELLDGAPGPLYEEAEAEFSRP